jgi:hypothetical protein
MRCVRGCGWGWNTEQAKEPEGQMERAIERLFHALAEGKASA